MIDVEQTLEGLGLEGYVRGDEFVSTCPMHLQRVGREDANPSWSINLTTGLFHCFSCGYRGSILTLIADLKGVPIETAKTMTVRPDLQTTITKLPGSYIHVPVRKVFPESKLAQFSDVPRWARQKRGVSKEACDLYGVRWSFLSDSWIIPIRAAEDSALLGWQEKSETQRIFRNFPTGVKKSQTLFGYDVFPGGRMVVVESPLDAVRLLSEGIPGAVATYGARVSKAQILLMSAADEVVFALDNPYIDDAGRKASIELLTETKGVLKAVRFFNYLGMEAKDPGEMSSTEIAVGIERARSRASGKAVVE